MERPSRYNENSGTPDVLSRRNFLRLLGVGTAGLGMVGMFESARTVYAYEADATARAERMCYKAISPDTSAEDRAEVIKTPYMRQCLSFMRDIYRNEHGKGIAREAFIQLGFLSSGLFLTGLVGIAVSSIKSNES